MKIQQETLPFRPITIKLESREEAKAFFDLIDKLESFRCNDNSNIKHTDFSDKEVSVLVGLSNARTEIKITI